MNEDLEPRPRRVTKGGNPKKHESHVLQPAIAPIPKVAPAISIYFELWRCKYCKFETNTEKNLIEHLKSHGRYL